MTATSETITYVRVALAGNPNSGKTSVFNALTGLNYKIGNYPGVTVEWKEGTLSVDHSHHVKVLDLPGTYSLIPRSPDEQIANDVLRGHSLEVAKPEIILVVIDTSALERSLFLLMQIADLGIPTIAILNMVDVAKSKGLQIDMKALAHALDMPVIPTIASKKKGIDEIKKTIAKFPNLAPSSRPWRDGPDDFQTDYERYVTSRYHWIEHVTSRVVKHHKPKPNWTNRIDQVLTHRFFGLLIFLGLMAIVFQSIFTWAQIPMQWIQNLMAWVSGKVALLIPPGDLQSLITDGIIAGVGNVISFLPQILLLFFFMGLMEDTGYMARAAFLMDKIMSRFGLHGKSFIPLLGCFACAIPGIMATRTIENRKTRLVTILVAPLMSCSARLPVYTLMIGAFIPNEKVLGFLTLPGLTLFSMYLLGIFFACLMAFIFRKTLIQGEAPIFVMELPSYKLPSLRLVLLHMWERSRLFIRRAGTIILSITIILWFFMSYPKHPNLTPSEQLQSSLAGQLGHAIEPVIKPLGFDWKIGIGLIASFAAREVLVSTMATIYNIQNTDENSLSLKEALRREINPETGKNVFTPLVAVALMVFFVLACQCMSTVAVVKRETNSWGWPLFMVVYMTLLAYGASFLTYQGGRLLGLG